MNLEALKGELIRDEGNRPWAYQDSEGWWTCGVGFLIDHRKGAVIPQPVIDFWLDWLLIKLQAQLRGALSWFDDMDDVRQRVLANMAYNMGITGLLGFKKALAACERKDYDAAADEIADSDAARELPDRYQRLIIMMRTGEIA